MGCAGKAGEMPAFFVRAKLRTAEAAGGREGIMKAGDDAKCGDRVDEDVVKDGKTGIGIGCGKDNAEDQHDLERGRELAINARRKWTIAGAENDDDGNDEDEHVAAQNKDGEPPSKFLFEGQNDEGRREQKFIGNGIEISTQRRALIEFPRDKTINAVGEAGNDENEQGPPVMLVRNKNEKERQKAEPEKGDLIGYGPDAALHYY